MPTLDRPEWVKTSLWCPYCGQLLLESKAHRIWDVVESCLYGHLYNRCRAYSVNENRKPGGLARTLGYGRKQRQ